MSPKQKTPKQLEKEVVLHLEDFPRQIAALKTAMGSFGGNFELREFKPAFEGRAGSETYNQVQAVERAFARVQNYIAQLSQNGTMLAGLELPRIQEGPAARAFEALKLAKVIDASTCRRLKQTQKVRSEVEHEYIEVKAGRLHKAVVLLAGTAPKFIAAYAAWIDQFLPD
jgi:uncharacterized protein YutE (UPF0331/DUF86 family)